MNSQYFVSARSCLFLTIVKIYIGLVQVYNPPEFCCWARKVAGPLLYFAFLLQQNNPSQQRKSNKATKFYRHIHLFKALRIKFSYTYICAEINLLRKFQWLKCIAKMHVGSKYLNSVFFPLGMMKLSIFKSRTWHSAFSTFSFVWIQHKYIRNLQSFGSAWVLIFHFSNDPVTKILSCWYSVFYGNNFWKWFATSSRASEAVKEVSPC